MKKQDTSKILYTRKEISVVLGVSASWVGKKLDVIPHYKNESIVRFDKEEVMKWFSTFAPKRNYPEETV